MNREEARYYLESSGFSEEQMNTIEQAFKPKPTDDATLRDIFCMGCEYKEQEPCEMTAEEYRQRMIQAFHNADTDELIAVCVLPTEKEFEHLEWLLKNHYKNEPCGDAIDRSKAIMIASGYCHPANVAKELAKLPPVNSQPCEDAISRQAVRHILNHEVKMPIKVWKKVFELVDDLPPVTPQPKTGRWISINNSFFLRYKCSECEQEPRDSRKYNYCPNCGAKMIEPQERSEEE